MSVRMKLALATSMALLLLLLIFYVGGRLILLESFRRTEMSVVRSAPDLARTIQAEMRQLGQTAAACRSDPGIGAACSERQPEAAGRAFPAAALAKHDLQMAALVDPAGQLFSSIYLPSRQAPPSTLSASLQRHLLPQSPLLTFTNQSVRVGLVVLDEGPMLVAVQRIPDDLAQPMAGVLVLGRDLHGKSVVRRLGAALPGLRIGVPLFEELQLAPVVSDEQPSSPRKGAAVDVAWRDGVAAPSAWRVAGLDGYEARLPVFDVYGNPSVSLVITMPRTFAPLAKVSLDWLLLFVAAVGICFIVPLLYMQGRAVINPLTRLAAEIQALPFRESAGRRLHEAGQNEFGVVARAVNTLLTAMEHSRLRLEHSESQSRALLAASPDIMYFFEKRGRLLSVKCPIGAEQFLAMTPEKAIGCDLHDVRVLPADLRMQLQERIDAVFATGQWQSLEFHAEYSDGLAYWGEFRIVPVNEHCALAIERNMTDRHKAERDRHLLEVRIGQKQKLESLGLLASGIAHDFNNILSAILGHAEDAAIKTMGGEPVVEPVTQIRKAAIRASGLTRQLQAYAGQGSVEPQTVNLNSMLRDMTLLLQTSLSKKATLEINMDPRVPAIMGDSSQLGQVAMNLLINASDALGNKPGVITLTTNRLEAAADELGEFLGANPLPAGVYALLEVRDTGRGMPPDVQARIFDPFFSTKAAGRGLGLSAVMGIVQAHGGGIAVRSTEQVGTVFRVVLPQGTAQVQADAVPVAVLPTTLPTLVPPVVGKSKRLVLLAEDDMDIRKVTTLALSSSGYEVLAAENGRVAASLFAQRAQDVQVVLLDQEMPEMTGEESFRAIRAIHADVPIVIMTGYGIHAAQTHFAPLHPSGLLSKPFTRVQLLEVLDQVVAKSAARAAKSHNHVSGE
jgi:PAS domain S-box-containing protein